MKGEYGAAVQSILQAELKGDLLSQYPEIWPLVRYPFSEYIAGRFRSSSSKKRRGFFKRAIFLLYSLCSKNPILACRKKFIFISHPRKKVISGNCIDIYTRPLIDLTGIDEDSACLEKIDEHGGHLGCGRNVYYLDCFLFASLFLSKIFMLNSKEKQLIGFLCDNFSHEVKSYEIKRFCCSVIKKNKAQSFLWGLYFKISQAKIVFVVNGAGNESVILAAKRNGITTIELQHGTPAQGKLNYDYPEGFLKQCFCDYFFSFGNKVLCSANLPVQKQRIIPMGFPFLEMRRSEVCSAVKDRVLVISQPNLRDVLKQILPKLALECSKPIYIKLHPGEVEYKSTIQSYYKNYPSIHVVDDTDFDLYELFSLSEVVLGFFSTALYEAVEFSARVVVLSNEFMSKSAINVDIDKAMEPAINGGFMHKVSNMSELIDELSLSAPQNLVNSPRIFLPFDSDRFLSVICAIEADR
ncbi:hypothetical protein ACFVYJ_06600 [Pontibacter sp. JAM-7]|uniref:hypothetical protein n=1 Tax=Pontibacter sp. JAM-7 TaxID=3366581 RepID=UPI003AF43C74